MAMFYEEENPLDDTAKIAIAIGVTALLVGGGYFLWKRSQEQKKTPQDETPMMGQGNVPAGGGGAAGGAAAGGGADIGSTSGGPQSSGPSVGETGGAAGGAAGGGGGPIISVAVAKSLVDTALEAYSNWKAGKLAPTVARTWLTRAIDAVQSLAAIGHGAANYKGRDLTDYLPTLRSELAEVEPAALVVSSTAFYGGGGTSAIGRAHQVTIPVTMPGFNPENDSWET